MLLRKISIRLHSLLDEEPIVEYLNSNIILLRWLISEGYGMLELLKEELKMEQWLAKSCPYEA